MINVIKASAGSGKTYQLTYEYIKLLLGEKAKGRYRLAKDHERHRHILAVTFTNKATGEMKERIVKELSILAGRVPGKKSQYMKDLCREFGGVSENDVQNAAERALVELLMDYTNFNVSTIDSFFQMILRTFAKELKMSYNYDVELDDKYAIRVGVNDFLSSVAFDKRMKHERGEAAEIKKERMTNAKNWIREFVKSEISNKSTSWNIFAKSEDVHKKQNYQKTFTFNDFADSLMKEELRVKVDDIIAYLGYDDENKAPNNYIHDFKNKLQERIDSTIKVAFSQKAIILGEVEQSGFTVEDISGNGGLHWVRKMGDTEKEFDITKLDISKFEQYKDKAEKWIKKPKKGSNRLNDENCVRDSIDRIIESVNKYYIYKDLHRNVYMLGLLGEISYYLSKFRQENGLILLADTNELLRKIINNEDMPFVYERVGIWLSHFLIDEFQDTSRAQWDNMRPLLYNSCAEGNDNLIIGDEKQCIYRFRNADPTLLRTDVSRQFTVRQNDSGKCTNWRSAPNVVNFNNEFFAKVASMLNCNDEYANLYQDLPAPEDKQYDNEGYIEVNFIEDDKEEKQETNAEENVEAEPNVEAKPKLKFKDKVLEQIPLMIKDMVSRGYQYSNVAVLVNTNTEGAEIINRILSYNKEIEDENERIPVVSSDSLLLCNSSAVRLIVSHLRYLDSKTLFDHGDKARETENYVHRVLRNYETLLMKGEKDAGEAIAESFETVKRKEEKDELVIRSLFPENTESFDIVSIVDRIIAQNMSTEDLQHENAFIQAFQDCVVDFSNRPNPTIHEFLKWWDRGGQRTSVNTPEGKDAVNVLTIHKSKGLEYKCVILPFCNWDMAGKDEILWLPKEQLVKSDLFAGVEEQLLPPVIPIKRNKNMQIETSCFKDFYNEKLHGRIVDQLNKTYVAFTRAVDELYIFTSAVGEKKESTLLSNYLNILEQEDAKYVLGSKGKGNDDKKKEESELMPLYNVMRFKGEGSEEDKNVGSKLQYIVSDMVTDEQREKGKRLHNLFMRIKYKDDAEFALRYSITKGIIPAECVESDSEIVRNAMADERVQEWFSRDNKVYNERSIVYKSKKSRPDRVVVTPDGRTIVVDYKFGEVHSDDHIEQVQKYMKYLAEMGFENIEGHLWYPFEEMIVDVENK